MKILKKYIVYLGLFFFLFSDVFSVHASDMEQTEEEYPSTEEISGEDFQELENTDEEKMNTVNKKNESRDRGMTKEAENIEETTESSKVEESVVSEFVEQKTNKALKDIEESKFSNTDKSDLNNSLMQEKEVFTKSVAAIELMEKTELIAAYDENNKKLTLKYKGTPLLGVSLGREVYPHFYLPKEIATVIEKRDIVAYHNIPLIGLGGLVLGRNEGWFNFEQINFVENQVYMTYSIPLAVAIGSSWYFTLEIKLEELPPTTSGEYMFYSQVVDRPLVNVSILEMNKVAQNKLTAPKFPAAPVIHNPVYTTHTTVTGTGEAYATVVLTINDEEQPPAQIDKDGNFSVAIPRQKSGTIIQAAVVNKRGHQSEDTSVTVREPPDTNPPNAPKVEQVYSKDTVVSGTGEAGTRVVLTIGDWTIGEGKVDSEGNFSVTIAEAQKPGTVITASLIDQEGNESEETTVTVKEATLSFLTVPDTLPFEPIPIGSEPVTAQRQDSDWSIEVMDTRGEGSNWRLTARAEQPIVSMSDSSRTLPNPLVYIDEQNNIQSLANGPVEVFSAETGTDPITAVKWKANQGPLVRITPTHAYAETYSTTINWELVDAP